MKEVAVICPLYRDYQYWLRENQKPGETYTFVDHIKPVLGKRFDRVEKIYRHEEIKELDEILEYLESHMRTIKDEDRK